MAQIDQVLAMRNAMFTVGDGMSLDSFMQGSIMAQAMMVAKTADSEEVAYEVLTYYFNIAMEALPIYWAERNHRATLESTGNTPENKGTKTPRYR